MSTFTSSLVSGILGGLVTSCLIYLWIKIFNSIFLPWYKNWIYQGIDLSGAWYCALPHSRQKIIFHIKQVANEITGEASHIANFTRDLQYEPFREFSISGIIQDRIVCITSKHKNNKRLGIGSFLLEITRDGRHLSGTFSYHDIMTSKIEVCNVLVFRDPKAKELCEHEESIKSPSLPEKSVKIRTLSKP